MSGPRPPAPLPLILLLTLMLSACGQRGPLYLPEEPPAQPAAPATSETPAEADVDDDDAAPR
jgi:predicted small lipoprotein YifL